MSVSSISIIYHSKFAESMLKNIKSLETSDIPSWEMPHLGIFPRNAIKGVRI